MIKILALALAVILPALVVALVKSDARPPMSEPPSLIDLPAVDRVAPPDAVIDVKATYGAVGDGKTDDTAAIQAGISANLGFGAKSKKVLYFPVGTYLVTRPLLWRLADGTWSTWLTLMGQNRDRTIIKLQDSAAGFGDPSAPQSVVVTASQNANRPDGSGNQAFHNFIFDLTVDVGAGNPGANGIDYLANNRGAIRNVVVRAPDDSGNVGISMTRRWPGPALLQDVRIQGFDVGIGMGLAEYSMTAENIRLAAQRTVAIANDGNVLTVRRLRSENTVPAIRNGPSALGLLTLVDSVLSGGAPHAAALENDGAFDIRRVQVKGYRTALQDHEVLHRAPSGSEWSSQSAPPPAGTAALELPIADDPPVPVHSEGRWAGVDSFRAGRKNEVDDTAAIQAALNSGNPVVYFSSGVYQVSRPLDVPASVQLIVGFDALINASDVNFDDPADNVVFRIRQSSPEPLVISSLLFEAPDNVVDVERLGMRPLALRDMHMVGVPFRGGPGPVYLSNVEGGQSWHFSVGQQVWARQFNVEQDDVKIYNRGADLLILGLKTEGAHMVIESTAGARTELLGGLLYPVGRPGKGVPAFTALNSSQSLTFAVSAYERNRNYRILVKSTRNGTTHDLKLEEASTRNDGSLVVLYSNMS